MLPPHSRPGLGEYAQGSRGLPRSRPRRWMMSRPTEVEVVPAGAALPLDPGPSDGRSDIGHRQEPAGGGPEGWGDREVLISHGIASGPTEGKKKKNKGVMWRSLYKEPFLGFD